MKSLLKPRYSQFHLMICFGGYLIVAADTTSLNRIMWILALAIFGFGVDAYYTRARRTCSCVDVPFGTYEVAVSVPTPDFMRGEEYGCYHVPDIADIDRCIVDDIRKLWDEQIITTGCCCGHNRIPPTVTVAPECEAKMERLGYERWGKHPHIFLLGGKDT